MAAHYASFVLCSLLCTLQLANAVLPSWTPTYQLNKSTFLYVCNYSGYTDVGPTSIVPRFGVVGGFMSWPGRPPNDDCCDASVCRRPLGHLATAFDWSNNKGSLATDLGVWSNDHPMDSEADLVVQARALKVVNPSAHIFVYRNLVKALPWMGSVRRLLEDPTLAPTLFLGFDPALAQPHSPRCDDSYSPPLCSALYHDQV